MAGVVLVAVIAVAIPAFASGHDGSRRTRRQLVCCSAMARPRRRAGRAAFHPPSQARQRLRRPTTGPCAQRANRTTGRSPRSGCAACGWIVTEPAGATGRVRLTPPLACEPPIICVPAGADRARVFCHPIPCILGRAHGNGTATGAGPTPGARFHAHPGLDRPDRPSGATDALVCPPLRARSPTPKAPHARPRHRRHAPLPALPCPIPNANIPGGATGTTGAIVCPLPPICRLAGASACPAPCVYAGVSAPTGTTGATATCPPIPICPPAPRTTAASTRPALYACPQIAAGTATSG